MAKGDERGLRFSIEENSISVRQHYAGGPVFSLTREQLQNHIDDVKAGKLDHLVQQKDPA